MNEDERIENSQRGAKAALARAEVSDIIFQTESAIVTKLVSHYAAGKLTHEFMLGAIAEIAAGRKLINHLQNEIKKGLEAQAERYS